ncbi:MAG: DNA polymerase IV [Granulosicoccus sp.]
MSSTSTHKDTQSLENNGAQPAVRKIIHVDMDAFYASVEQRDNPKLQGLPVIVGGKPNGRGVVAACSYEARKFGVRSAMPSAEAYRRCPQAVFVKSRFDAYKEASKQIHTVFNEFTDLVEPLSLDEAYLDVSNNTLFEGSAFRLAREIKTMIWERTQLVASAGVSYNKFLAKIASDYDKPDGIYCILPEDGESFVASLAVGRIHGVGKVTEQRMHALGIHTGADLRRWSEEELSLEFGKSARYYYLVARGIDHRPVRVSRTRKSLGLERTFGQNILKREEMLDVLHTLAEELLRELSAKQWVSTTVTIKVRFADFTTYTRAHSESKAVLDKSLVSRVLPFLLDRVLETRENSQSTQTTVGRPAVMLKKKGVRLLGLSFRGLRPVEEYSPTQLEIDWGADEGPAVEEG